METRHLQGRHAKPAAIRRSGRRHARRVASAGGRPAARLRAELRATRTCGASIREARGSEPPRRRPSRSLRSTRSDLIPNLTPDGSRVVFLSDRSGESEFWVGDPDGSNAFQLTSMGILPDTRGGARPTPIAFTATQTAGLTCWLCRPVVVGRETSPKARLAAPIKLLSRWPMDLFFVRSRTWRVAHLEGTGDRRHTSPSDEQRRCHRHRICRR